MHATTELSFEASVREWTPHHFPLQGHMESLGHLLQQEKAPKRLYDSTCMSSFRCLQPSAVMALSHEQHVQTHGNSCCEYYLSVQGH